MKQFSVPTKDVRNRPRVWIVAGVLLATTAALLAFVLPSAAASAKVAVPKLAPSKRPPSSLPPRSRPERPSSTGSAPFRRRGTSFRAARTRCWVRRSTRRRRRCRRRSTAASRPTGRTSCRRSGYGLVGPIIQAQVGDTILVHFKNFDPGNPHSMHFHGVHYEVASDGAYIPGVSGPGADVKPGQTFTYKLEAGADSAGVWPYHDHSPSMDRRFAAACTARCRSAREGSASPTGSSSSTSRSSSTSTRSTGSRSSTTRPRFARRSATSCNGTCSASATTTTASTCTGIAGRPPTAPRDVQTVSPAESFVFRWKEDKAGTWLYHCHVEEHMMNGMIGLYVVTK